jgi:hypothetical protein
VAVLTRSACQYMGTAFWKKLWTGRLKCGLTDNEILPRFRLPTALRLLSSTTGRGQVRSGWNVTRLPGSGSRSGWEHQWIFDSDHTSSWSCWRLGLGQSFGLLVFNNLNKERSQGLCSYGSLLLNFFLVQIGGLWAGNEKTYTHSIGAGQEDDIGVSRIDTGQEDFYCSITFWKIDSGQEYDVTRIKLCTWLDSMNNLTLVRKESVRLW